MDVVVSTQHGEVDDNLSASDLDNVFKNLTQGSQEEHLVVSCAGMKRCNRKFVNNSGLVPYVSTSDSSDEDDSVDVLNDSPPDSPVFCCPPKTVAKSDRPARFKEPTSKEDLQELAGKSFAKSTDRKINWAVNLF